MELYQPIEHGSYNVLQYLLKRDRGASVKVQLHDCFRTASHVHVTAMVLRSICEILVEDL